MKAYCINLDRRPDRWQLAQEQFAAHGLEVERFAAIDGKDFRNQYFCDNANNGCTLSHYFIVERAKLLGLELVVIFEDDVQLHPEFNGLLHRCMQDLPEDWDMLYFGGTHKQKLEPITANISRVFLTYTTHGYIVRKSLFDRLISELPKLNAPVDCVFAAFQYNYQCYVTNPPLAWQRADHSDLVGRWMDYPWLQSNEQ